VAVDDEEIGTEIRCPYRNCGKPIFVLPRDVAAAAWAEETLETVRPAMFRAHPFVAMGLCGAAAVGVAGVWRWTTGELADRLSGAALLTGSVILAAASVSALLGWWAVARCTSLQVTDQRSLIHRGVLVRRTREIRHRDVHRVQVHQTAWQRLAGIGQLSIFRAGQEESEIVVRGIPRPHDIAELIRNQR
jgi:uncharacterized membrane protein YdbT with pleckstrin-like domain